MSFNPDPNNRAQEVIFSRRINKADDHILVFNKNNVSEANSQKHLGIVLSNDLSFKKHLKMISNKAFETIGLLRKLFNILQRSALLINLVVLI